MREAILIFVLLVVSVMSITFVYWLTRRLLAQNEVLLQSWGR